MYGIPRDKALIFKNFIQQTDGAADGRCSTLSFEIRDGEVVQPGVSWVYVWKEASAAAKIVRIGATWLHPAARAAKHVGEGNPGKIDVVAFAVPDGVDRGRARDFLAKALKESGCLAPEATVGSAGAVFLDRLETPATASEAAFVKIMLSGLTVMGSAE